jgi:tryptophan synthase alpha chain
MNGSRIAATFQRLAREGRVGLVTYVTAGDPDLARSAEILLALDRAGADVLEVGVPFSDPLADGPVIQRASERALAAGATLPAVLELVASLRPRLEAPVVLFSYANPLLRMGVDRFVARAAAAGIDGVLVLDLPLEEAGPFHERLAGAGLDPIFLVSPTTSDERLRRAAALGRGFLYLISRLGVTGARTDLAAEARGLAERVRRVTSLPRAVGFGISRPDHVVEVGRWAEAAVVGSALVERIAAAADAPDLVEQVQQFVRGLREAAASRAERAANG